MAEVDHPKIRRRDKKRKRAHLEELAQKDETDEGTAFYSTQYINDEEFDDGNGGSSEQYGQDSSGDEIEHGHDHGHEHDNGNGIIYKVIFLILLVMLAGISTLVLLENNNTEIDAENAIHEHIQPNIVNSEQKMNQNDVEIEDDSFAGKLASFFDSFMDGDQGEHDHDDHDAHDDHDDHDEEHDDDEEHGEDEHAEHGDDHSHSDEDGDDHSHEHPYEVYNNEETLRSEINENLANAQQEVPPAGETQSNDNQEPVPAPEPSPEVNKEQQEALSSTTPEDKTPEVQDSNPETNNVEPDHVDPAPAQSPPENDDDATFNTPEDELLESML